jgi:DNA-directed RNA polymerase subunit RPC12/RpoP
MERRKLFGDEVVAKRSLFSSKATTSRRKLFCSAASSTPRVIVCLDCGHEITVDGTTEKEFCPNCGGTRFEVKGVNSGRRSFFAIDKTQPKSSESGQEDSTKSEKGSECQECGSMEIGKPDATDEILKEFSGKSISEEDLQKLFTERGVSESVESLINSGYASLNDEGMVCFSENADFARRMFSEIVISVTKELHLVPAENKVEELVDELEGHNNISPKGIVILKKAHGLIPRNSGSIKSFSESAESYLEDSGLASDLKLEWGGKKMSLKEFMDILNTQYNDAPDDILDVLVDSGIIRISGSQVEII